MGILLTLGVVGLTNSQKSSRDNERVGDVEAIVNNLESFYVTGAPATTETTNITNLSPNPALGSNSTGWVTSNDGTPGVNSHQISGGPTGITSNFYRREASSVATGDSIRIWVVGAGTSAIPASPNTTYMFSGYMRSSFYLTDGIDIRVQQSNSGGSTTSDLTGPSSTPQAPNVWQRVVRFFTTGSDTAYVRPKLEFLGLTGAPTGSTFEATAFMMVQGTGLYDYHDGSSSGWSWNGTAHNSTSTGPAGAGSIDPGSYPTISLISSGVLFVRLPDADSKSFTAPGQTDPAASFIPATNAVQTTAGVLPQPTISTYVYQPLKSDGTLCSYDSEECRKFNIYYRLEADDTVHMVTSKSQ